MLNNANIIGVFVLSMIFSWDYQLSRVTALSFYFDLEK